MLRKIAVFVSSLNEGYQNRVMRGIQDFAASHEAMICVFVAAGGLVPNPSYDAGEYQIYRLPDLREFDGVILLANTIQSREIVVEIIARIRKANVPFVSIDVDFDAESGFVGTDNSASMRTLTEHLINVHECRSFAFLSGPEESAESAARLQSVRDVLHEYGLELDPARIYQGDFTQQTGKKCARTLLRERRDGKPLPDVLICANDSMALAAVTMFEIRGVSVPQDIIVTGFDNIDDTRCFMPELTTISRPLSETGYQACKLLLECVDHPAGPKKRVVLEANPIYAKTCGCHIDGIFADEALKKENFQIVMSFRNGILETNSIHCALAGCEDISQIVEYMKPFISKLRCESFFLCMNDEWIGEKDALLGTQYPDAASERRGHDYTKSVSIPIAYQDGKFSSYDSFQTRNLLPNLFKERTKGSTCYFFPVHFRERCMGYMAISGCRSVLDSPSIHAWVLTICTAIENVRKICCMNAITGVLERLYVIDPLTGIYNRNGFARKSRKLCEIAIEQHLPVMVMFADLDGLKTINDSHGHSAGDAALKEVGSILQRICTNNEVCCRFGGDEFLVMKVNATAEQGDALAKKFREEAENFSKSAAHPFDLSASIGYHIEVPTEDSTIFQMIAVADQKMYEQKKRKKQSKYIRKD